jgi:hypothetical protein
MFVSSPLFFHKCQQIKSLQGLFSCFRRQDSSIGFGAPVRANMRGNRLIDAAITSSLLETVCSCIATLLHLQVGLS